MGCHKSNFKQQAYSDTGLIQETNKSQTNNLTLHLKKPQKEEQTKLKERKGRNNKNQSRSKIK